MVSVSRVKSVKKYFQFSLSLDSPQGEHNIPSEGWKKIVILPCVRHIKGLLDKEFWAAWELSEVSAALR